MLKTLALILLIISPSFQKTKDEWTDRRIYQLLTDRFASSKGDSANCELSNYCGGDFQGIIDHLDYIQGMGFDAIWISPVVDNYGNGYHGYWARDMYGINSHYGDAATLKKLVAECHKRDIWVMVDIVANHVKKMGNTDQNYTQNKPFNDAAHYHDYCIISQSDFDSHNLHNIEHCRLVGLADLNHQNAWVADQLIQWGQWLVSEFGFDAIRADTVMMVPADFWKRFSDAVGVYTIGEVFDGDFGFLKQFVGPLNSLLNYPNFYWLKGVFNNWDDMNKIETFYGQWKNAIGWSSMKYLGNFNDNHDNARFLNNNNNDSGRKKFKAYTAFCLTSYGIPIVYYGSEQFYDGGNDPQNRETLWGNMNTSHEMYKYIATINKATKSTGALSQDQIQRWSSAELYAFSRGKLFAAFSSKQDKQIHQTITSHPYSEGQKICNIFFPKDDCQTITGGKLELYLNYGEVKIFIPA